MNALRPMGRVGSRNMYLGPDGSTGMRYREAKTAHAELARLRGELDAAVSYSMATGFGDHALIGSLDAAIAKAEGK